MTVAAFTFSVRELMVLAPIMFKAKFAISTFEAIKKSPKKRRGDFSPQLINQ
jgi:hypothetical protein